MAKKTVKKASVKKKVAVKKADVKGKPAVRAGSSGKLNASTKVKGIDGNSGSTSKYKKGK